MSAQPAPTANHNQSNPGDTIISIRAVIPVSDAGLVIGKAGQNVQEIRTQTNARIRVSEFLRGCKERLLIIGGTASQVSKAYGIVLEKISASHKEHQDAVSADGSSDHIHQLNLLAPDAFMGAIIGKNGSKIRDIQQKSGAHLAASDSPLPNSTERLLTFSSKSLDELNIALNEYCLLISSLIAGQLATGGQRLANQIHFEPVAGYQILRSPRKPNGGTRSTTTTARSPATFEVEEGMESEVVNVPSELVGAIIGRQGARIKDFCRQSNSVIRIADPQQGATERQVFVTAAARENIETALRLIYSCLESERERLSSAQVPEESQQ